MLFAGLINDQLKYISNLADNVTKRGIVSSVKAYTGPEYADINEALFEGASMTSVHSTIVDDIDYIFSKIPATRHEIVVYRGFSKEFQGGFFPGYFSSSVDPSIALEFATDENPDLVVMVIVPPGSKIMPVEQISANPREDEIILPRGSTFDLDGVSVVRGLPYVVARLVHGRKKVVIDPPKLVTPDPSPDKLELSSVEIIKLLVNGVDEEELELFGIIEAVDLVKTQLEDALGINIDTELIEKVIVMLSV